MNFQREPRPYQTVLLAAAIFIAIFLATILMGPAIDHEFNEMDRRAQEAQPCEVEL